MSISRKICTGISALALSGSIYGGIKSWNAREEASEKLENAASNYETQKLLSKKDGSTAGLIGCSAGLFASAIAGAYFLLIDRIERNLTYP